MTKGAFCLNIIRLKSSEDYLVFLQHILKYSLLVILFISCCFIWKILQPLCVDKEADLPMCTGPMVDSKCICKLNTDRRISRGQYKCLNTAHGIFQLLVPVLLWRESVTSIDELSIDSSLNLLQFRRILVISYSLEDASFTIDLVFWLWMVHLNHELHGPSNSICEQSHSDILIIKC